MAYLHKTMETFADLPLLPFDSQKPWEAWLELQHAKSKGVWLMIAKKASGVQSITYEQALESALCYGWIDGQKRSYDDTFFLQKFTPRRPKSVWSKINVDKVALLTKQGKMKPSGLGEVEAAKQDGRWEQAYASPSQMSVPPDFQAELDRNPAAKAFFLSLNKTNRYSFLWRITTAKRPETRRARIETSITMLSAGKKFH